MTQVAADWVQVSGLASAAALGTGHHTGMAISSGRSGQGPSSVTFRVVSSTASMPTSSGFTVNWVVKAPSSPASGTPSRYRWALWMG